MASVPSLLLVSGVVVHPLVSLFKSISTLKKVETGHIAVRTSSYYGINQQSKEIKVHGLLYIIENANSGDGLLIVDDVFDSGISIQGIHSKS
jgi:hypoxanthine phosphoribosyltransferase